MATSGFDKLPVEVVGAIAENFHTATWACIAFPHAGSDEVDTSSLYSLCLTSKKLYNAAMPVLYHNLPCLQKSLNNNTDAELRAWKHVVTLFIRSITEDNSLGGYVRTAVFTQSSLRTLGQTIGAMDALMATASAVNPAFIEALESMIQKDFDFSVSEYVMNVREADAAANNIPRSQLMGHVMMIILLKMMPNLTHYDLPGHHTTTGARLFHLLHMQNLGVKTLDARLQEGATGSFLNGFSRLESLTILELQMTSQYSPKSEQAWQALSPMLHLKHLRVSGFLLLKPMISHLLSQCHGGLRTFSYMKADYTDSADGENAQRGWPLASAADIMQGLRLQSNSLRTLELYLSPTGQWPQVGPDLSDFRCLRKVCLGIARCWGAGWPYWEALPRAIRHLRLIPDINESGLIEDSIEESRLEQELPSRLMGLVQAQSHDPKPYPFLKHVECIIQRGRPDFQALRAALASVDIVLTIKPY